MRWDAHLHADFLAVDDLDSRDNVVDNNTNVCAVAHRQVLDLQVHAGQHHEHSSSLPKAHALTSISCEREHSPLQPALQALDAARSKGVDHGTDAKLLAIELALTMIV